MQFIYIQDNAVVWLCKVINDFSDENFLPAVPDKNDWSSREKEDGGGSFLAESDETNTGACW